MKCKNKTYQSLIEKGYTFAQIKNIVESMKKMPAEKWQLKNKE